MKDSIATTYRYFKQHFCVGEDVYYIDRKVHGLTPKVCGYIFDMDKSRLSELVGVKGIEDIQIISEM